MERILEKVIALALCLLLVLLSGVSGIAVAAVLLSVALSSLSELRTSRRWLAEGCQLLYVACAMIVPELLLCLPLAAFDLFKLRIKPLRFAWLLPLAVAALSARGGVAAVVGQGPAPQIMLASFLLSTITSILAWRSGKMSAAMAALASRRDGLEEASRVQALQNRDISERRELELRLATLKERERIAREIHDNIGHLLTRSVLQVEALQVVRAGDDMLTAELEGVKQTLSDAFGAVRASVHDLYDDALELGAQLEEIAAKTSWPAIRLDLRFSNVPPVVARTFLAIVQEALANVKRHSDAANMSIAVVEFPGLHQLTVQDNGSRCPDILKQPPVLPQTGIGGAGGIAHAAAERGVTVGGNWDAAHGGIGLSSMAQRCRALGGALRISWDKGFKIIATVPKEAA